MKLILHLNPRKRIKKDDLHTQTTDTYETFFIFNYPYWVLFC
jgi:hypothetical protein